MQDLQAMKSAADEAGKRFDEVCRPHFCDGRWGAYRALEYGQALPRNVEAALDEYNSAVMAYYLARDGDRGFLGARGV